MKRTRKTAAFLLALAVGAAAAAPAFAEGEVPSPVIELTFDNSDLTATSGQATATRRITYVGGISGKAAYLDGSARIALSDANGTSLLANKTSLTVSLWAKFDSPTGWYFYAAPDDNAQTYRSEKYLGILDTNNGTITGERYNSCGQDRPVQATASGAKTSDWNHIVAVYDEDSTTVYVNGVAGETVNNMPNIGDILGDDPVTYIGYANWGEGEYAKASFDEYKIYDVALSAEEISSIYNSEKPGVLLDNQPYENLDSAMAYINTDETRGDHTIELLSDQTLSGDSFYAGYQKATTITSAEGSKYTVTLAPENVNANIFIWDGVTFDNVKLTQSADSTINTLCAYQGSNNGYKNNSLDLNNVEMTGITAGDCISVFGSNDIKQSKVTGNTAKATLFSNRTDSVIENSEITGNKTENFGTVEISMAPTTIKNSTIKDNTTTHGDVQLRSGGTVVLNGNTEIGTLYDEGGTINIGSDFTGSVTVTLSDNNFEDGRVIAASVEEGANVSGVTVNGLPTDMELKVAEGKLVVAEKAPEKATATLETAEWTTTDDKYTVDNENSNELTAPDGTTVYGYKAAFNDLGNVTYTKAEANVTNAETEATMSQEKDIAGITTEGGVVFYIISNAELDTDASTIVLE